MVAAATDFAFTITAQQIGDAVEQSGQPAYRYLFGENATGTVIEAPGGGTLTNTWARLGSFHSLDVAFLFGNFGSYFAEFRALWPAAASTAVAEQLSASMMAYYISFATRGDPNGGDATTHLGALQGVLPPWPRWGTAGEGKYMQLGGPDGIAVGSGFHGPQLSLWARLADQAGLGFGTTATSGTTSTPRLISAVSSHKPSVGDDVLIGIAVCVVVLAAVIVGSFVLKARQATDADAEYEDGLILVG